MSQIPVQAACPENQGNNLPGPATGVTRRLLRRTRGWMLALVMLLAAIGAQAQAVFRPQPVGSAAPEQDVTVTATTAGTVQTVAVLTLGASGLDFAAGTGASTCASATLAAGGTCAEPVTFTPAAQPTTRARPWARSTPCVR